MKERSFEDSYQRLLMTCEILETCQKHLLETTSACIDNDDPNPNKALAAKQLFLSREHIRKCTKSLRAALANL